MPFYVFVEYPLLTAFVIVVVVSMVMNSLLAKRPGAGLHQLSGWRRCIRCGKDHPNHAAFCRHCGHRLGNR